MGILDILGPLSRSNRAPYELGDIRPAGQKMQYYDGPPAAFTVNTLISGAGYSDTTEATAQRNSAVFACLQALATAFPEPPLRVYRVRSGQSEPDPQSPIQRLLDTPNPHLSAEQILAWVVTAMHVNGNAYLRKIRNQRGAVLELWPISPTRLEPKTVTPGDFISYYRYSYRPGQFVDLAPEDVIHFRLGLDDEDHRLGLSPLRRLLRHVSSDDSASKFADALLRNFAVPGLVVQLPAEVRMTPEEAAEMKASVAAAYGADNRGNVGVLTGGATMQTLGFSPEQMDLRTLHRIPEERIAAVLGVPAIVAGLGAGLDRSTFSNMREAREMFTESKLVPLWRNVAATLEQQLVPDFGGTDITIAFDLADVRALHDDANQRYDRLTQAVQGGWMTVNEARAQIGLPAIAGGDDLEGNSDAQTDNDDDNMPVVMRMAARFSIKAAGDIPDDLEGINDDNVGLWTRNVQQYLRDRAQALADQLRATGGVLQWDTEAEVAELRGVLDPMRLAVLDDVNKIVQGALGIAFELDDPLTRRYLRESGALIRNITEHTRRLVQDALLAGQAEFEGLDQLTARVLELGAFNKARARVIARTELGFSTNAAAIANYRASGQVIGVTVYDGDLHPPCAAMIGKRYPLDQHPPLLAHPNCRRAFAPILVGEEI